MTFKESRVCQARQGLLNMPITSPTVTLLHTSPHVNMSATPMLLTVTAVVTFALSLAWLFAVWRGTGKALANPLTLRISNIPGSISKDEFERILTDVAAEIIV